MGSYRFVLWPWIVCLFGNELWICQLLRGMAMAMMTELEKTGKRKTMQRRQTTDDREPDGGGRRIDDSIAASGKNPIG